MRHGGLIGLLGASLVTYRDTLPTVTSFISITSPVARQQPMAAQELGHTPDGGARTTRPSKRTSSSRVPAKRLRPAKIAMQRIRQGTCTTMLGTRVPAVVRLCPSWRGGGPSRRTSVPIPYPSAGPEATDARTFCQSAPMETVALCLIAGAPIAAYTMNTGLIQGGQVGLVDVVGRRVAYVSPVSASARL